MDVTTDQLIGKSSHGMHQKVSGNCLNDVFYKFWTVGFDAFPFPGGSDSFVGDGFSSETVFSKLRFDVAEVSSGRQVDEQDAAFVGKFDSVSLSWNPLFDGIFHTFVYIPPELHDMWIG